MKMLARTFFDTVRIAPGVPIRGYEILQRYYMPNTPHDTTEEVFQCSRYRQIDTVQTSPSRHLPKPSTVRSL